MAPPSPIPDRSPAWRVLDVLAFAGLWAGGVAAALTWAAGRAVGAGERPRALAWACALAGAGTVVVYVIDRLRDLERDRASAPARTAFVAGHRRGLRATAAAAAIACVPAASRLPPTAWMLCGAVLVVGLLHRRLKGPRTATIVYVAAAWVAVVVGLPTSIAARDGVRLLPVGVTAASLGLAIASNAMASDLRGRRFDADAARRVRRARGLGLVAAVLPIALPGLAPLGLVGVGAWGAAALFRPGERYGLVVVDGALLAGGLAAALLVRPPIL
jgi:4-hydroxybenzoate polyprenyltransferase